MPDEQTNTNIMSDIASRIAEAHNILIALSSDPSVDELSAAIGLSICLDRAGKRATAIYSGTTPDALEFLKPEETFESSADALQDFVIAISKDKADHLRYKLDGDYVRIFITPYKTRIDEEDLEFSYGDFNIDLVLALDVASGTDLDAALREHGRIMHDASIINITTGNPGKFGEIIWSDKTKSSVSEMVAELLYGMKKIPIEKEEATAFLTGIIVATNRFLNASTTSSAMQIASRLMESGANQQLISENLTGDTDNQMFSFNNDLKDRRAEDASESSLTVEHNTSADDDTADEPSTDSEPTKGEIAAPEATPEATSEVTPEAAPEVTPEVTPSSSIVPDELQATAEVLSGVGAEAIAPSQNTPVTLTPSADFSADSSLTGAKDYGKMLEEALAENPASAIAPIVSSTPEIDGVPEMNYDSLPSSDILPPPPTPPIDANAITPPTAPPDIITPPTAPPDITTPPTAPLDTIAPPNTPPDTTLSPTTFQIPGA